jgi:predicted ATPase
VVPEESFASMNSLDRIRVAGYRSIRDQTVELRPLNLLIGANGSGKSNFVGVFRLLTEITSERLQLFVAQIGGADQILHFGRKVTERLVLELLFGENGYICDLVPTASDSLVFEHEEVFAQGASASSGGGAKETFLQELDEDAADPDVLRFAFTALPSWRVYHFHDTSALARVKQKGDLQDNTVLRSDAGNLAAFLYRLQETRPDILSNIKGIVRMVAPFFGDFQLQPDRINPDRIRLEWREKGSDSHFDAHALSDGTLRFICLATLLLQPNAPHVILVDEPELGLHPYAITVLADLLRSAATRTQVIVSTQSVTLVNQFGPEDILVVDREDGASVFRRLTSQEIESWLDDYALGELWEKNVLGGRPGA